MAENRKNKKRKTTSTKKLLVYDKVEVRSIEEGLHGSWHHGVVIGCGKQSRHVRYTNILKDDGSHRMDEVVKVSPLLDGLVPGDSWTTTCRGNIRPLPPSIDIRKCSLHYGQTVDVLVKDAWWEGVIFDHEDGSDERRVFFPDLGDELKATIDIVRITQDWNEVTDEWKPRGNWLLLELLEEVKLNWPLLVSERQIWYEVQMKLSFEKLDWTYSYRGFWKGLLWQVLCSSYSLTMKNMLNEITSTGDFEAENKWLLESSAAEFGLFLKPEEFFCDSQAIVHHGTESQSDSICLVSNKSGGSLEGGNLTNLVASPGEIEYVSTSKPLISFLSQDSNFEVGSATNNEGRHSIRLDQKLKRKYESSGERPGLTWLPSELCMDIVAENCPDSVYQYTAASGSGSRVLPVNVQKHLLFLGWKIQVANDGKMNRRRYISPKGETYYSLQKVCLELQCGDRLLTCNDNGRKNDEVAVSLISSQLSEKPREQIGASKKLSKDIVHVEKEHFPSAVVEYSKLKNYNKTCRMKSSNNLSLKAKKHLSAVGWSFYYIEKRGGKKEMRYESPQGKTFYSLLTACNWYLKDGNCSLSFTPGKQVRAEGTLQFTCANSSSSSVSMESEVMIEELSKKLSIGPSVEKALPNQLVQKGDIQVQGSVKHPRRKKRGLLQQSTALLQQDHQEDGSMSVDSSDSTKKGDGVKSGFSAYELPTTKRARQVIVSSPTHQTPRTILSWLIDSNIILPRTKAHYRNRKNGLSMKEGKISREGIKCSCCQEVFTLSKFEAHAGSNLHRPSANIFLVDGRSIFECQLQLKRQNKVKTTRSEPRQGSDNQHQFVNDSICSVCHYGGELLLCDQCPSSFHTRCVGLKDIPKGDWFCPSCCCGICGLGRFKEYKEQFTDDSSMHCGQCEHQYHIGCLRSRDLIRPDHRPGGNWFCSARCEQIHLSLQNLLGKPIPVGHDNLAWTLLKYKGAEVSENNVLDNEYLMESYSKLNVALSIMHECFELAEDSRTRRDLVEDVIFSRWSELHRLNFQGFYTVALERNDELITVATIRIYGDKVAEIPLVGTRFQYRRLGMCRILMHELEKKLKELGVERLVLPAAPGVLKTWQTSFGFSTMKEAERLNFLDCTFLDFQGTIMCQKPLKSTPCHDFSSQSSGKFDDLMYFQMHRMLPPPTPPFSAEVQEKVYDHISQNEVELPLT